MKNRYKHYFSALACYEGEVSRLTETTKRTIAKEIIEKANERNIPLPKDRSLVEHLAEHEHRVPAQLYAVIGEIVRLMKQLDQM
ncbi:flagellar biosynthesis protein FlhB [Anoxybacteroides amylolyticum]|uniref:FlhB HrpN YscU SpaS family protein n=1 Tax=Anoxybacteroides amylolyticum TaxID=294699 RepID=A0A160F1X2_9BACL|nr:flagellar biosynthesis protein FlhB [Anoxybacillus amylolyticus]ANB60187.1 hypothetical protein GFC30_503 [Anoxybacillus amylolyticus]